MVFLGLRRGGVLAEDHRSGAGFPETDRGAIANIPPKANRRAPPPFDAELYKQRNLIERFFNKIKHFRRIATRYEKRASNYLAMIKLASIRIWLRSNESMA